MKYAVIAVALAFLPASSFAQEAAPALDGLWISRNAFGPDLVGEASLIREAELLRMNLAGVSALQEGRDLVMPNGRGRLHLGRMQSGRTLRAWWIQPEGLAGQSYMTPAIFHRDGAARWRGQVAPLMQSFTLYLSFTHNEQGRLVAAFRNPEFNMNGGASRLLVRVDGEEIVFSTTDGQERRRATWSSDSDRLRLSWPPLSAPIELRRATTEEAAAFYPRAPGSYAVQRPQSTDDGWRTARPGAVGIDEAALTALVQSVSDADPAALRPQLLHSLLVSRRGRLVLEEYFHGYGRDVAHDTRSVAKTFSSVLLGALMQSGENIGPRTRIYDLAGGQVANLDPRKSHITLAHLLTHTSGLACNDNDETSPGGEGAMQSQSEQPDWHRYTLNLPMAYDPGARYAYCSGGVNLVGAALRAATGESVPELFDRLIAQPLQFGRYHWNLAPNGEGYLGGGAYLRPRDMAKVGQLYLNGGVWNGRRIVSRAWVEESTSPHVEINEQTTGLDAETFANIALRGADGYAWHRYGVRVGERLIGAYEANGNGGQFIIVVPEYDLVVVMTGGNYGQGAIWNSWRHDIAGAVISAIRN